eukprot:m.196714 g.196714  ORF g.196714 m.196714 type:complete len:288 (-) comp15257_c0_seq3:255-1118(-)
MSANAFSAARMTTVVTVLMAALMPTTQSATIIVAGDSWGTVGKNQFAAIAEARGLTVENIAIGGSTADQWSQEHLLLALFEAISRNRDVKTVWLTVGGNDVMNGLSQGMTMEQVLAKLATDTAVILDHMKKSAPNVITIQFGYDIPNYGSSMSCLAKAAAFAHECSAEWAAVAAKGWNPFVNCSNSKTAMLQDVYVRGLGEKAKKEGWNYVAADMLGIFQYLNGDIGTIGKPSHTVFGPDIYWQNDCIHPNSFGFTNLFIQFFERYLDDAMGLGANRTRHRPARRDL